jgi:hypothetical protein
VSLENEVAALGRRATLRERYRESHDTITNRVWYYRTVAQRHLGQFQRAGFLRRTTVVPLNPAPGPQPYRAAVIYGMPTGGFWGGEDAGRSPGVISFRSLMVPRGYAWVTNDDDDYRTMERYFSG